MTSGAIHCGVPRVPGNGTPNLIADPKSASFAVSGVSPISTFAPFTSQWTTFRA
ncbi:hypothetical protein HanRHA438_Chr04g0170711 [Helianthus annuus]|nr:hypothetical protein HanRHA438_Chr04g0170711 [Helianthus annuus]